MQLEPDANERTGGILGGAADPSTPAARADATVEGFTFAFAIGSGVMLAAFVILSLWLRRGDVEVGESAAAGQRPRQPVEVPASA